MSPGKFPDDTTDAFNRDTVVLAKDTPIDNEHLNGNVTEDSQGIGVREVSFLDLKKVSIGIKNEAQQNLPNISNVDVALAKADNDDESP